MTTTPAAPPAVQEPRVSDEKLAKWMLTPLLELQGKLTMADWYDAIMDLRDARATIASQAEALAATKAENADKRLVASGDLRAKALAWWKANRTSRVTEVYVKGDGYLRFEWDDGAEGGPYHVPIETVLNTTAEAALKAAREALAVALPQAEGCFANHYGDNPEGAAEPEHIRLMRAALTPKEP